MLKPIWIVGFTGHRPKGEKGRTKEELESCSARIEKAFKDFQAMAGDAGGEIHFFASVAEGADTIAIEVAQRLGIVVHLILPMSVRRFSEDFQAGAIAWDRALTLIAKSGGLLDLDDEEVTQICQHGSGKYQVRADLPSPETSWTFRISNGSRERPYCYYECGEEMLEACDGLISVHSQSTNKMGGTTEVIQQAKAKGMIVATIDPLDDALQWNSEAPRWQVDPVMAELLEIGEKSSDQVSDGAGQSELLQAEYDRYDGLSLVNGKWFRYSMVTGVLLHFAAATIGIASLSFHGGIIATFVELLLVVAAIFLTWLSWKNHYHEHWRQARFAAEVLRSLNHSCRFVDPLMPMISRHHPLWHRFAITHSLNAPVCKKLAELEQLKRYHEERVVDQLNYYTSKLSPASLFGGMCNKVAKISALAALAFIVIALSDKIFDFKEIVTGWGMLSDVTTKFFPAFLPLLASVAISLTIVTDYGRRKERYSIMTNRLQELSKWFPTIRSPYAAQRAVERCEEILLDELVEWYSANKEIAH